MIWDGKDRRKNNRETQVLTKAILTANANFTGYHKDMEYLKKGQDDIKAEGKLHTQEIKSLNTQVAGILPQVKNNRNGVKDNRVWIRSIVIIVGGGILIALVSLIPKLLAEIK